MATKLMGLSLGLDRSDPLDSRRADAHRTPSEPPTHGHSLRRGELAGVGIDTLQDPTSRYD